MKSDSDGNAKNPKAVATAPPSPSDTKPEDELEPPVEVEMPPIINESTDDGKNYNLKTLTGNTELIYGQGSIGDTKKIDAQPIKNGITLAGEVYMDIIDDPVFNNPSRSANDELNNFKKVMDGRATPSLYGTVEYYLSYGSTVGNSIAPTVPTDGKVVVDGITYTYAGTPIQTSFTVPEVEAFKSSYMYMRGYVQRTVGVYDSQNTYRILTIKGVYGMELQLDDQQEWKVNTLAYTERSQTVQ